MTQVTWEGQQSQFVLTLLSYKKWPLKNLNVKPTVVKKKKSILKSGLLFWKESEPSAALLCNPPLFTLSSVSSPSAHSTKLSISLSLYNSIEEYNLLGAKHGYGSGDFTAFDFLLFTTWFWLLLFGKSKRQTGRADQRSDLWLWGTHSTTRKYRCRFFLPFTPSKPFQAWQLCQCLSPRHAYADSECFFCAIEGVCDSLKFDVIIMYVRISGSNWVWIGLLYMGCNWN